MTAGIARLAGLEEFDDARKTAGEVLGLRRFRAGFSPGHLRVAPRSPSCTIKCAREGMRYFFRVRPAESRT